MSAALVLCAGAVAFWGGYFARRSYRVTARGGDRRLAGAEPFTACGFGALSIGALFDLNSTAYVGALTASAGALASARLERPR